jgi:hypothetical protein
LFCWVSDRAEQGSSIKCTHLCHCSAGSDTPQDFVLWGIRPSLQIKTPQNQLKKFESLTFSLKGHYSKTVCMHKLHYPRHIGSVLKDPHILKINFCSAGSDTPGNNFLNSNNFKNTSQNSKMFQGMNQGPIWGQFMKNQKPKILCYFTFKALFFRICKKIKGEYTCVAAKKRKGLYYLNSYNFLISVPSVMNSLHE